MLFTQPLPGEAPQEAPLGWLAGMYFAFLRSAKQNYLQKKVPLYSCQCGGRNKMQNTRNNRDEEFEFDGWQKSAKSPETSDRLRLIRMQKKSTTTEEKPTRNPHKAKKWDFFNSAVSSDS